ncbi:MAG TPA: hypothetical protein VN512_09630, partial [Clostridia bacterium]|nr:hypothetical protein [Clostridia bacterium]
NMTVPDVFCQNSVGHCCNLSQTFINPQMLATKPLAQSLVFHTQITNKPVSCGARSAKNKQEARRKI